MANEISVSVNCTITQSGQSVAGAQTFSANLAATSFLGAEVTIGSTTAALLSLGGLSNPSVIMVVNQDTTNFVMIDNILALSNFPQKLLPGQSILLLPETGTLYAKADTAPCQVWVVAG